MATGIMYRKLFQNLFLSPEGIHYLQNLWRILKLHQTDGRVFFVFWACIPMGKGTFGDNTLAYPDLPAVEPYLQGAAAMQPVATINMATCFILFI